jgi:hypothetical protein
MSFFQEGTRFSQNEDYENYRLSEFVNPHSHHKYSSHQEDIPVFSFPPNHDCLIKREESWMNVIFENPRLDDAESKAKFTESALIKDDSFQDEFLTFEKTTSAYAGSKAISEPENAKVILYSVV